jgi:hypothetical protein
LNICRSPCVCPTSPKRHPRPACASHCRSKPPPPESSPAQRSNDGSVYASHPRSRRRCRCVVVVHMPVKLSHFRRENVAQTPSPNGGCERGKGPRGQGVMAQGGWFAATPPIAPVSSLQHLHLLRVIHPSIHSLIVR